MAKLQLDCLMRGDRIRYPGSGEYEVISDVVAEETGFVSFYLLDPTARRAVKHVGQARTVVMCKNR